MSERTGKADIHIHSAADDGLNTPAEILDYAEHHTDLDVIAITDHDTIEGGLEAAELAARGGYRVQVIPGIEVSSRRGHVLALGVSRPIRMLQSLADTIAAVQEQGGFVVIPHPLSWLTFSVGERALDQVLADPQLATCVLGLEMLNPSFAGRVAVERVRHLNQTRWRLSETGGSDSHSVSLIGSAYTSFSGQTADDLRRALAAGTTQVGGRFWSVSDHTSIARQQFWRAMVTAPRQRFPRALRLFLREHRDPESSS
ncbi:MAG: phosphotransferase [Chloroflexi bacterium]|nr:phosphotransferase [Chloroflexota bacterium]MBU1749127.1 phosphotransferase [Chloroflexota bacterium]